MGALEVFLDDTPGEVRGVIVRDGRYDRLLVQRDDDVPEHRLGAQCVGRIVDVHPGLKGAFVDLGAPAPLGFRPFSGKERLNVGHKVRVEVVAEPRESKGPTLRSLGAGEGEPRLLTSGPSVAEQLAREAPGVEVVTGAAAIRAVLEAEEEALARSHAFADTGLDLAVERTRALVAVDLDLSPAPGVAFGPPARARANRQGLAEAARLIRLRRWGGLVAIDLIGTVHDSTAVTAAARRAFGEDSDIVYGPVNRFGVLQLSLPWRLTPLEEALDGPGGVRRAARRVQDMVRALRLRLLTDTGAARIAVRCAAVDAQSAGPLVARLGPRAHLIADPALPAGTFHWEQD